MSTVMDVAAVHRAARARLGQTNRRDLGVVSATDVARFATAIGVDPGEDVPPLYLTSVLGWTAGPPEDDLPPDGALPDQLAGLDTGAVRLMGAGQNIEFLATVEVGMTVTEQTTIESAELKHGRSGDLTVVEVARELTTEDTTLLRCVETFIVR